MTTAARLRAEADESVGAEGSKLLASFCAETISIAEAEFLAGNRDGRFDCSL
jgi:hypothetical protein